jgi:hypothetical protein
MLASAVLSPPLVFFHQPVPLARSKTASRRYLIGLTVLNAGECTTVLCLRPAGYCPGDQPLTTNLKWSLGCFGRRDRLSCTTVSGIKYAATFICISFWDFGGRVESRMPPWAQNVDRRCTAPDSFGVYQWLYNVILNTEHRSCMIKLILLERATRSKPFLLAFWRNTLRYAIWGILLCLEIFSTVHV